MGLGDAFSKATSAATDFVINSADSLADNRDRLKERFGNNPKRHVYTKYNLPDDINLVDLFNGKIFSYVDFDAVIACLRKNNWSTCENLYTLNSLSKELVPETTMHCLQSKNARGMLKLYPGLIKLCIRKRRGLLVYIDVVSDKIYNITSIKSFMSHVELNDGIALRDLWIPLADALPKLRPKKLKASVTHEEVKQAKRAELREKNLSECVGQNKAAHGQTSIFEADSINTLELFKTAYACALACTNTDKITDDDAFDILLHKLMNYREDLSSLSIRDYLAAIEDKYKSLGMADFQDALAESNAGVMHSLRLILDIPEGSGESNEEFVAATYTLLLQTFNIQEDTFECKTSKDMLDVFFKLKLEAEEAARKAEEEAQKAEEAKHASTTADALLNVQKLSKERREPQPEQEPQASTDESEPKDLADIFTDKEEEFL